MTIEEVNTFLKRVFPQIDDQFVLEDLGDVTRMRMPFKTENLRPGGTISGPAMFALADVCFYVATFSRLGPEALCVTTNLNINFMRRPDPVDMIGAARVLKMGRALAVGDVTLYSADKPEPVAHASVTYSIPPKPSGIGV